MEDYDGIPPGKCGFVVGLQKGVKICAVIMIILDLIDIVILSVVYAHIFSPFVGQNETSKPEDNSVYGMDLEGGVSDNGQFNRKSITASLIMFCILLMVWEVVNVLADIILLRAATQADTKVLDIWKVYGIVICTFHGVGIGMSIIMFRVFTIIIEVLLFSFNLYTVILVKKLRADIRMTPNSYMRLSSIS